jgi:membrane-bound serine protease (ClpP class)
VVTRIQSPGGRVDVAEDMLDLTLQQDPPGGPRLVAWVDSSAYSAAALVAYGHHEVYLGPNARIGDIGVIFINQAEGTIEYAPEKIRSVVRTLLRKTAQRRGWDEALLLKMTEKDWELYRARLRDGSTRHVIEEDKDRFIADTPAFDPSASGALVRLFGKDHLLTLTSHEAVEKRMATAMASDLDAVWKAHGINPANVIDLTPTTNEELAWSLAPWAPVLLGLAVLFVFLELKVAGAGIFIILAAICGTLFVVTQFALDLMNNLELVLMIIGLAAIAVELFTMIGAGLLGVAGGALFLIGMVMAFLANGVSFETEGWSDAVSAAIGQSLMSLGVLVVGVAGLLVLLPRTGLLQRLGARAVISDTAPGTITGTEADPLLGRTGVALSDLRPNGRVSIDGIEYGATARHGQHIAGGSQVRVLGRAFGELDVDASHESST